MAEPSAFTLETAASSPMEVLQIALERFEVLQRVSSVGWLRELVRIEIDVLPG